MIIGAIKERAPGEARVALTPEVVKKLHGQGFRVLIEQDAGREAHFTDESYIVAGGQIVPTAAEVMDTSNILLTINPLGNDAFVKGMGKLKRDTVVLGLFAPHRHTDHLTTLAKGGVTTFSLELLPRITRAQAMDVLSSQNNLAGYKAVVNAAALYPRAIPMMMTAAGTIPAARVLVLGAGVAGLQAIATARRLGAIVSAFDVRAAAKEQVESLGASFVMVESEGDFQTAGGYARETTDAYKIKQAEKLAQVMPKIDIVICTALIPGKAAPILVTESMVDAMRPGSVIYDLAAESGGNCALTKAGKSRVHKGVTIVGPQNILADIAFDASQVFARNCNAFLQLMTSGGDIKGGLNFDWQDEILQATALTFQGNIIHPLFKNAA